MNVLIASFGVVLHGEQHALLYKFERISMTGISRNVLVTGASRGIGKQIALNYGRLKYNIVLIILLIKKRQN